LAGRYPNACLYSPDDRTERLKFRIGDDSVIPCGFCGRENDDQSRFCIDCGKPVVTGGARVIDVASLRQSSGPNVPAVPGVDPRASRAKGVPNTRVSSNAAPGSGSSSNGGAVKKCPSCGAVSDAAFPFCPQCGANRDVAPSAGRPSGTAVFTARATSNAPKLSLLNEAGEVTKSFTLDRGEATFGRNDGDFRFPEDVYLSPVHAQLSARDGQLYVRDLGSRNGTWIFTDAPYRLQDGDTILVGSQLIRFRRLGYPGPHPPEADQTRRLGSFTPSADIAVLAQLRADGSARDTLHLSPGRSVKIGRDVGDWVFPYDQTMSGKHAEIRSEDLEFIVLDDGSRNGIAVSVRGEKPVKPGQRILIGDQTMRVESV
jgi:pSer/pThr/pTyr-binding forkhead associated (FHA) protein